MSSTPKGVKMSKELLFYENCPVCDQKLKCIMDEEGFVIDWFCSKCSISWTLEDLEYEPIQDNLSKWLK